MKYLLSISTAIEKLVLKLGDWSAWAFVLMMVTICFDVLSRQFGFQIPGMGSTRLQELEWHFHLGLFVCWLGANYVRNKHVRVDVAAARLSEKTRVCIELVGIIVLAFPFISLALFYAGEYAWLSFSQSEGSSAPNGLGARWVIKSVLVLGLAALWFAVFAKLCRCIVFLFASPALAAKAKPLGNSGVQGAH